MSPRLPALVGGVALVAAGAILLLRNLGVLPAGVDLWPVVLVAVGVVLLVTGLQQRHAGEPAPEAAAASLDGAREAGLVLKHGAGALDVTPLDAAAAGEERLFEGSFAGGVRQEAHHTGQRLQVTLRHPADIDRLARQSGGLWWSVRLGRAAPLDLEVHSGASRVRLELAELPLRSLRLQVGASDVDVRLPPDCQVHVGAGAADVRLHVPGSAAASITARSALASVKVDEGRFPRAGQGFRSPGYDTAEHRVDITLEGGVASFRVD